MICDVIGIEIPLLKSKMAAKYFALCQKTFPGRFAFDNVGNRTKTDLVTLIFLNARDLSKIIMLEFMS